MPGIVADRYNEIVVLQLLTQGTAQDGCAPSAGWRCWPQQPWVGTIVERADARVRELERLGPAQEEPIWVRDGGGAALQTVFVINGVRFHFDAAQDRRPERFSISG